MSSEEASSSPGQSASSSQVHDRASSSEVAALKDALLLKLQRDRKKQRRDAVGALMEKECEDLMKYMKAALSRSLDEEKLIYIDAAPSSDNHKGTSISPIKNALELSDAMIRTGERLQNQTRKIQIFTASPDDAATPGPSTASTPQLPLPPLPPATQTTTAFSTQTAMGYNKLFSSADVAKKAGSITQNEKAAKTQVVKIVKQLQDKRAQMATLEAQRCEMDSTGNFKAESIEARLPSHAKTKVQKRRFVIQEQKPYIDVEKKIKKLKVSIDSLEVKRETAQAEVNKCRNELKEFDLRNDRSSQ